MVPQIVRLRRLQFFRQLQRNQQPPAPERAESGRRFRLDDADHAQFLLVRHDGKSAPASEFPPLRRRPAASAPRSAARVPCRSAYTADPKAAAQGRSAESPRPPPVPKRNSLHPVKRAALARRFRHPGHHRRIRIPVVVNFSGEANFGVNLDHVWQRFNLAAAHRHRAGELRAAAFLRAASARAHQSR